VTPEQKDALEQIARAVTAGAVGPNVFRTVSSSFTEIETLRASLVLADARINDLIGKTK
jgi:hypothetical protein